MLRPNVTIASNVYVRASEDLEKDPSYVAAVNDASALRKLSVELSGTLSKVRLSPWQSQILQETSSCIINARAGRKDFTHGLVKTETGFSWACRCEYRECEKYDMCMSELYSVRIERGQSQIEEAVSRFEFLGDISSIFAPPIETEALPPPNPELVPEPVDDEMPMSAFLYKEIEEAGIIVSADIRSHILVNAGPGSGKTHTIIKRLEHIAKSRAVTDFSSVLVLCCTKAARNEIVKRLEEGISSGELPVEARMFCVCTFDSFAAAYLAGIEEEGLSLLGCNDRIAKFNEKFDPEMLANFEYAIIDELQDVVNERANMTLLILRGLSCGWLMCGDKCQAIYDYDCEGPDTMSSAGFYKEIEGNLPNDAEKYELTGNRRQIKELARDSDKLRQALLNGDPSVVDAAFQSVTGAYRPIVFKKLLADSKGDGTTAILCRSNIDAEWVSSSLCDKGARHSLIRSATSSPPLNRWIADVFWDYREKWCSREDFVERYLARVKDNQALANESFDALAKSQSADFISLDSVRKTLAQADLAPILLNVPDERVTVSTIHKAKGREFDTVYLVGAFDPEPKSATSEARVWYVGMTRPRKELHLIKPSGKCFRRPTPMGRRACIKLKKDRYGKGTSSYVSEIMIGLPGDINDFAFAQGSLAEAVAIQSYIAASVKVYDNVLITLKSGKYEIKHKGRKIGELSSRVRGDFMEAVKMTDNKKRPPSFISNVFISNIITVMPRQFPSGTERMFKESQFWLGVEITGLGKVDWRYGSSQG